MRDDRLCIREERKSVTGFGAVTSGAWNPAKNGNNPEVISFGTHLNPTALYRAQLIDCVGSSQAALVLGGNTGKGTTDTGVAADFTIAATPPSQTVTAGNGTSYTANVGVINGFNDTVSLSVSGLPTGAKKKAS